MLKNICRRQKKNNEKFPSMQLNLWSAGVVNGALRVKVICTLYRCSAINLSRFPIARGDLELLGTGGLQSNC